MLLVFYQAAEAGAIIAGRAAQGIQTVLQALGLRLGFRDQAVRLGLGVGHNQVRLLARVAHRLVAHPLRVGEHFLHALAVVRGRGRRRRRALAHRRGAQGLNLALHFFEFVRDFVQEHIDFFRIIAVRLGLEFLGLNHLDGNCHTSRPPVNMS